MFTNTLSKNATNALALLGRNKILPVNTYLAGGSALALHFGHRVSVDFDFFTNAHFESEKIAGLLRKLGDFDVDTLTEDTLLGQFMSVKFSLFYYKYPLLFEPAKFEGINIAATGDISAMKIAAIMDRGTKKDFIDVYFLDKKGTTLEECLKYYDKKYKALANNMYSIITSLSYFVDAEESEMPKMIESISWKDVKKFFEREAVRLGKKYLTSK